jgi:hypothetical protein
MKQSRKVSGILLSIGLILILSLFFVNIIKTNPNSQIAGNIANPVKSPSPAVSPFPSAVVMKPSPTPPDFPTHVAETLTAMPPTIAPTPTATSTLAPPACTFPLAQTTTAESMIEEYTFSEPQVVLTAPQGNIYNIAEWLPDSQRVLITEELRNNPKGLDSIELYNPETGEVEGYAIRTITQELPAWQPELNAVVYPIMNYFDIDTKAGTYKFTRQLWVSSGSSDAAQMLADNLPQLPFAIKPGDGEMVYLSDKELSKRDKSLDELPPIPVDPAQWDYAKTQRDDQSVSYKMIWQPNTSLIFLYSEGAMGGGGYTFILNADTGHICELNLGGWAELAHWSSDGRYLAIIGVKEHSFIFPTSNLTLLDTATGNLTTLSITPQETEHHYVYDFVWAPDNRHLLALGSTPFSQGTQGESNFQELYLVDLVSGESINIFSAYKFYTNSPQSMAWSPDSSGLIIRCPTMEVDRICFISVQRVGQ